MILDNIKKQNTAKTAVRTAPKFQKMRSAEHNDTKEISKVKEPEHLKSFKSTEILEEENPAQLENEPDIQDTLDSNQLRQAVVWSEILQKKF